MDLCTAAGEGVGGSRAVVDSAGGPAPGTVEAEGRGSAPGTVEVRGRGSAPGTVEVRGRGSAPGTVKSENKIKRYED